MANRMAMMPAGRMISCSVLASIRTEGPPPWADDRVPTRRAARAARVRATGEHLPRFLDMRSRAGPCRPSRSVTRREKAGQTRPRGAICSRVMAPAGPEASPYTARLVTRRPMLGCLFEIVETLVLTLIIFFVIQTFIAQPYKVQQQSMEHTLEPDQYVLVDKLTPRFDTYKRGDIVVFKPPPDFGVQADDTPFIKRVIG